VDLIDADVVAWLTGRYSYDREALFIAEAIATEFSDEWDGPECRRDADPGSCRGTASRQEK